MFFQSLVSRLGFREKFALIAILAALAVEAASSSISSAIALQSTESEEIAQLIARISRATVQNTRALEGTADSARILEGLAVGLRESIQRFRLPRARMSGGAGVIELL